MLSTQFTWGQKLEGVKKFVASKVYHRPRLINLEVTKFCNAACGFCTCWQTTEHPQLDSYDDLLKRFRPIVLSISGGEPLLRKDIVEIVRNARQYCSYIMMITHGQLLTEEKADQLKEAGINQISISLNHLGKRHDEERKIEGLFDHISQLAPKLRDKGEDFLAFNTVIMNENLDQIIPIIHQAREWGVKLGLSCYNALKTNDSSLMVTQANQEHLEEIVKEILKLRKEFGHIMTSEYYLNRIPEYFRTGRIPDCQAGLNFIQVTPDGYVKRCSEMPVLCHYTEYDAQKIGQTDCDVCWFSCRGETETPLSPQRIWEFIQK